MSLTAAVWWTIGAAWLVVAVLIALQVIRLVRELVRALDRAAGYADLPVFAALERAEANAARIEAAVGQLDPLAARARSALATIKRGPFPPEVIAAYVWLRKELAAYRMARR